MHRVHHFDTSEAAYDACFDDSPCIEEGDVVAILAEGVIGLASTDPIAITIETGAFRHVRPMPGAELLRELVHDAVQLRHAVELALAHHLPVLPHFLPFALRTVPLPAGQAIVALTLDDILVAIDAIQHREVHFARRVALSDAHSDLGMFLGSALRKLATARGRLVEHSPIAPLDIPEDDRCTPPPYIVVT